MFDFLTLLKRPRKKRNKKYARFNRRMLAATLDSMALIALAPLFDWLTPLDTQSLQMVPYDPQAPHAVSDLFKMILTNKPFILSWLANFGIQMAAFCLFSAICWHFWAATPGKLLLRMRIVDVTTENPLSDRQITLRIAGYCLSMLGFFLGFLWIGIDKKHRAWHDRIAHTAVIILPWQDIPVMARLIAKWQRLRAKIARECRKLLYKNPPNDNGPL